jgi:hypothetical protein
MTDVIITNRAIDDGRFGIGVEDSAASNDASPSYEIIALQAYQRYLASGGSSGSKEDRFGVEYPSKSTPGRNEALSQTSC